MFKFLTKQFLYGRLYLWLKERIGGILLLAISIFLIFYFHNEYLNYIEYKTKFEESYIGLSFIIKNILILLIAGGYFYFYFFLNKANKSINILLVKYASDPPFKITQFPDLKHKLEISEVTFGLLS